MKRTLIGATLALALASPAGADIPRHHTARVAQVSVGKSALPKGHLAPGRLGIVFSGSGCNPNLVTGQTPSAAQWNSYFSCAFPAIGGLLGGPLGLPASTVSSASLNIPPGVTPATPSNGDIWIDSSGLEVQVAGSTIGPLGAGGGGGGGTLLGWQPTPSFSQLGASDAVSHAVSLPSGVDDVIQNTSLNDAYCTVAAGVPTATTATLLVPAKSSLPFDYGGVFTEVACLSPNSTLAVNIAGGLGLWTGGAGGGSGSGSSSGVDQMTIPGGGITSISGSVWGVAPAGLEVIGANVNVLALPPLASGSSSIGLVGLNAGTQTIGTVLVGGTLPAFAATPTFNIGTIGTVASAANQTNGTAVTQLADASGTKVGTGGSGNGLTVTCTNCSGGGGGGGGGGGTPQTTNSVAINLSSATTTQLIGASGSNLTYITQFNIVAGATGGISLEYGTGTNCSVVVGTLTGVYPWTAQNGIALGSGLGAIFLPIPAGDEVCAVTTGSVSMQGSIGYTQSTGTISSFGGGGGGASPFVSNGNYINNAAVSTSSTNATLTSSPAALLVNNIGTVSIELKAVSTSGGTVTAATADLVVPANSVMELGTNGNGFVAYAAVGGAGSVQITEGSGLFSGAGGGGSGSGGGGGSGTPDSTLTATGTISAADVGCVPTTWANGQIVLTCASITANSSLQFASFSGVQTGILICSGTASGTFEFDAMMDSASPAHYVKRGVNELLGGASPNEAGNFGSQIIGEINLTGAVGGQIRSTVYTSGSPAPCTLRVSNNLANVHISNLLPPGKDTQINVTTTTTGTSLINGVAGQTIHVSAWEFQAGGTTTYSLGYSASTSCTGITTIAGPWSLTSTVPPNTLGDGIADVLTLPAGDTLCEVSTGSSVTVGGHVHATQM